MLGSAIYTGQVYHKRYGPKEHTLSYRSFFMLFDLDELPALQNISSLFAWNRRAWFSFRESDFGPLLAGKNDDAPGTLKRELEVLLANHGLVDSEWHFQLLTMPRTLGYAFNPISLVYCRDANTTVRAMIYEVNNTFGERIHYVMPVENDEKRIRQSCKKELFVSPFFDMQGDYLFDVSEPEKKLSFRIDYLVDRELKLRASFSGVRQSFTAKNLRALALNNSVATYKVVLGIHWEAMKLWWKGLPLVNHVPLIVQDDDIPVGHQATGSPSKKSSKITYKPHTYSLHHSNPDSTLKKNELEDP